jgi:hypothetical protein
MIFKTVTSLTLIAALAISQVTAQEGTNQPGVQATNSDSNPTVETYDGGESGNAKWGLYGGWGYPGYSSYYGWGYPGYRYWGWGNSYGW